MSNLQSLSRIDKELGFNGNVWKMCTVKCCFIFSFFAEKIFFLFVCYVTEFPFWHLVPKLILWNIVRPYLQKFSKMSIFFKLRLLFKSKVWSYPNLKIVFSKKLQQLWWNGSLQYIQFWYAIEKVGKVKDLGKFLK